MTIFHRPGCSQTRDPDVWRGRDELMQTCPECARAAPADPGMELPSRPTGTLPQIPKAPPPPSTGWPTHRARRRRRAKRHAARKRSDRYTLGGIPSP